ncbi:hypothetical protein GGR30_000934 [Martelella radicis]|uniref:Uncharacterized protein n=1 Tax=Martelella radicis TaxID=1397476 RepID=A0A7W6KGT3_9HYPH|nr:hypothetical protein [Martelella radicis]
MRRKPADIQFCENARVPLTLCAAVANDGSDVCMRRA